MQVASGCFSHDLAPTYKVDIADYRQRYGDLQSFALDIGQKLTTSWKVHCVTAHLEQFLDIVKVGMAVYAEQTSEAAHAVLKPVEKRFLVQEDNPRHKKQLKKVASGFSGPRI